MEAFKTAARSLEAMPRRCPWRNRPSLPSNCYRYLLLGRQYALLYQVREDAVLDCRQEYGFLFPSEPVFTTVRSHQSWSFAALPRPVMNTDSKSVAARLRRPIFYSSTFRPPTSSPSSQV